MQVDVTDCFRFQEREGAVKATAIDGILYQDHHLRVHLCDVTDKPAEDKAIFVGNLSFCKCCCIIWTALMIVFFLFRC